MGIASQLFEQHPTTTESVFFSNPTRVTCTQPLSNHVNLFGHIHEYILYVSMWKRPVHESMLNKERSLQKIQQSSTWTDCLSSWLYSLRCPAFCKWNIMGQPAKCRQHRPHHRSEEDYDWSTHSRMGNWIRHRRWTMCCLGHQCTTSRSALPTIWRFTEATEDRGKRSKTQQTIPICHFR